MISFRKFKDPYHSVRKEFLCDGESDLNDLPTTCEPGSVALIIDTSETYMLNNERQWIKVTFGGGGGSGPDYDEVIYDGGVI